MEVSNISASNVEKFVAEQIRQGKEKYFQENNDLETKRKQALKDKNKNEYLKLSFETNQAINKSVHAVTPLIEKTIPLNNDEIKYLVRNAQYITRNILKLQPVKFKKDVPGIEQTRAMYKFYNEIELEYYKDMVVCSSLNQQQKAQANAMKPIVVTDQLQDKYGYNSEELDYLIDLYGLQNE